MARRLPLLMLVVVVLFLVLVLAPPLVLSAFRAPKTLRPQQKTKPTNFLKQAGKLLLKLVPDLISTPPSSGDEEEDRAASAPSSGDEEEDRAASAAGSYIFSLSVGTPAQSIDGVLDIGLSFIWAQCKCDPCSPQPVPTFQPGTSKTFTTLPCTGQTCRRTLNQTCGGTDATEDSCRYIVDYGDGTTNTTGYLASDTVVFPDTPYPGVVLGCSDASFGDFSGASGFFGFGRGALSLVSQLQLRWFSYYLASGDSGSLLQFDDDNATLPTPSGRSQSTPLLRNSVYPDQYYVKLNGIRVNGNNLSGIPAGTFDIHANGSGGVFLSTAMPLTFLERAAYDVVRQAFVQGISLEPVDGSKLGLDLCYTKQSLDQVKIPTLTLVFDGASKGMELKKKNYFFADNETNLECLTILPSPGVSLLGSLLQTDRNITYDISGGQLIFEPASASAPPPQLKVSLLVAVQLVVAWALLF